MANIARVRTVFTGVGGSPFYNNLYFGGIDNLINAQDCVDAVDVAWTTLTTIMNGALIGAIEAEVPIIEDTTGEIQSVVSTTGGVVDPTSAAEPLPTAAQGLVRLSTNTFVDGRRLRGRVFVPGLTEASQSTGQPNSSTIASLANFGQVIIDDTSVNLVIFRRPRAADPDANPPVTARAGTSASVTASTGWGEFAVLRSRRD